MCSATAGLFVAKQIRLGHQSVVSSIRSRLVGVCQLRSPVSTQHSGNVEMRKWEVDICTDFCGREGNRYW